MRSHQYLRASPRSHVFSRDCLEVDIGVSRSRTLTLFINHFKSMMGGRRNTRGRRLGQAKAVREIVSERFGQSARDHPWVVLGDLNDYLGTDSQGQTGIGELVGWEQLENVVERLPEEERWTHYYKGANAYRQLDYLLPSTSLAQASPGRPEVVRGGLPRRAERYRGPRFPGVGEHNPKASDHCPVVMELQL